jgi:hypothetical protein
MIRARLELDCEIQPVDEPVINRALDSSRLRAETGIEAPSWTEMLDDYLTREREMHEAKA